MFLLKKLMQNIKQLRCAICWRSIVEGDYIEAHGPQPIIFCGEHGIKNKKSIVVDNQYTITRQEEQNACPPRRVGIMDAVQDVQFLSLMGRPCCDGAAPPSKT